MYTYNIQSSANGGRRIKRSKPVLTTKGVLGQPRLHEMLSQNKANQELKLRSPYCIYVQEKCSEPSPAVVSTLLLFNWLSSKVVGPGLHTTQRHVRVSLRLEQRQATKRKRLIMWMIKKNNVDDSKISHRLRSCQGKENLERANFI